MIPKTPLQKLLENTKWKDIYDEHYNTSDIEKEQSVLPKGEELVQHFYSKAWFKRIKKTKDVED